MGEEERMNEASEAAANGSTTPEQKGKDVPEASANGTTPEHKGGDVPRTKEEVTNEVKDMEEDMKNDEEVGAQNMDVDQEGGKNKETKEEDKNEEMKEETRNGVMEEEMNTRENEESKGNVKEKVDELVEDEERDGESKQRKGSKGHGKGKTYGTKTNSKKKEVEKVQKTPVASSAANRPVRSRKSVERLVESFEMESVKEFHIEKGRGTALKDIPNVAFKLSKWKTDDTLKMLHTILFGRRGKAAQVKSNIYKFSGFVQTENEEKQKIKVKEKLDKIVKEKLLGFCEVLDIPIAKADTTKTNTRKEDIIAKLIDFLVAPQATTTDLLSEKEQSSKGTKRKRADKESASMSGRTPSKHSAKASKDREKKDTEETKDHSDEEKEEEEQEEENGVPERSKNKVPEQSASEESKGEFEDESAEDANEDKHGSRKLSAEKKSAGKEKPKKVATRKKSSPPTKRTPVKSSSNSKGDDRSGTSLKTFSRRKRTEVVKEKSSSNRSKVDVSDTSPKTFSRKKRTEAVKDDGRSDTSPKIYSRKKKTEVVKEKSSILKKPASMEKTGKKSVKGKDKPKEHKLRPSDDELRNAICEILKEVDFNTATFTDILKQLAERYKTDLTPRKSSIKLMIQNELTKLADETDDEEEED